MLSSLSLFVVVVANVWVFASAQQACTPVDSNIDPKDLPKISTQFQTRIEIFSNENKDVLETLVKFDADNNIAQVVYRQNNGTFSESYFYLQNEVFIRFNTACQIGKLNESFGSFFFGAAQDQFGNYHIKSPNDFLFWNNGVPHKKLDQVTYRGITADHYQSCQWFNVPGVTNTTFLVDYYFKTPDYKSPIELTGFEAYSQIPLGFTARGIEQATSKPFNREYYFFEYKNFLEYRQDITNEREGEYCVGQTYKLPVPIIPNHFSFVYQEIGINIVDTGRFFYSSDWKVTREDITDPFFSVKDPVKIIHDFYSGVDYVINKIRNTCTQDNLGSNKNAKFNAAKLDMRHYMVMKTPNDLFEIDDSYFFAGNRYERGIKSDVYVTKRVINPLLNASLPSNQIVAEAIFGKIQESDYIGVDDYEPVFPVSVHLYQPSLPEPIILNTFDFDSVLKRSSFDISNCFSEKDIIRYALRFNYPEGLSQHRFDREFGRRLEEAFDLEVMKIISVYNASPLRILAAKFEAFERYFTIESGFTDHAEPIYQFAKSQKKKIKNAGETIVADSAESCARACVYKTMYANSPDPKCLSFDFYTSPSGARCTLFSFTRYTNPNIEYDDEIIDTYSKIVETFDSVDEKPLYALIQESVARREFVIKAKNTTGTEFTFMADELFEIILDQNGNTGGFTSFFEEFSLFGKDTDFDVDEVKKRPALMLRERTGITIDECSRQCLREAAFVCELMTYGKANRECKWTSLPNIYNVQDDDTKDLFREVPTFDLFERDPFYNYRKYPYMVSSVVGLTSIEVKDARECALKCNTDKSINCRSFNFCQGVSKKFYCIRSELNVFSSERDPLIVDSSLCDHYSKLAIGDFKVEIGIGLGVKPESTVTRDSVEGCAELCSFEDKYLCRSFDYVIDTSTCRFYRENIVDKALTDLKLTEDTGINHYSRLYYVKDGVLKSVEPMKIKESSSYGAGTVIGILIVVIIGGFLFGIMSTFVYMKVSRKTNFLPVMKFSNPNYHQQTNE